MPRYSKEINIGRRYTCKIRGKDAVVRVKYVDTAGYTKHSTVRIICAREITNEKIVFRSPARLIAELGEQFPAFWRPKRTVAPELPRLGEVAIHRFLMALEIGTHNALTIWACKHKVTVPHGEYKGRVRIAVKSLLQRGSHGK